MTDHKEAFFNKWLGSSGGSAATQTPPQQQVPADHKAYRVKLTIRKEQAATETFWAEPLAELNDLHLLPEDKAYIHGFLVALQLPDALAVGLLRQYRHTWEQAAGRAAKANQAENEGRRTANRWLQEGAPGYVLRRVEMQKSGGSDT